MSPYITTPCIHRSEARKNYPRSGTHVFITANIALAVLAATLAIGYVMIMQNLVSRGYEAHRMEEQLATLRENHDVLSRALGELRSPEALTAYLASTELVSADRIEHVKDGAGTAVAKFDGNFAR